MGRLGPALAVLATVHGLGVLLFSAGFLLTRTELQEYSSCDAPPRIEINHSTAELTQSSRLGTPAGACWSGQPPVDETSAHRAAAQPGPPFSKLILVVIDAMRFDMAMPYFPSEHHQDREAAFYKGRMPVFARALNASHDVNREHGHINAELFRFLADAPTTSMQRLKGITTGALPTFVDVGASFGGGTVAEDNIILQMEQRGFRVELMGDDTWIDLFPNSFHRKSPFPSFNVKDLHTVDTGVRKQLIPALRRSEEWDCLIAHFLGVDHAGHTYGVKSQQMSDKIDEMNDVMTELLDELRRSSDKFEDTLLLVMSDHGQNMHGDHGGATWEEVDSFLFAMSMKKRPFEVPQKFRTPCRSFPEYGSEACYSAIPQINLAPSLALLLGFAIPYGSLGTVSPELWFLASSQTAERDHQHWIQSYADALQVNSAQVQRYLKAYSTAFTASSLSQASDAELGAILERAEESKKLSYVGGSDSVGSTEDAQERIRQLEQAILLYQTYLAGVADIARAAWTQFTPGYMVLGVILLVVSAFLILTLFVSVRSRLDTAIALVGLVLQPAGLLSNSFIVAEDSVVHFCQTTIILLLLGAVVHGQAARPAHGWRDGFYSICLIGASWQVSMILQEDHYSSKTRLMWSLCCLLTTGCLSTSSSSSVWVHSICGIDLRVSAEDISVKPADRIPRGRVTYPSSRGEEQNKHPVRVTDSDGTIPDVSNQRWCELMTMLDRDLQFWFPLLLALIASFWIFSELVASPDDSTSKLSASVFQWPKQMSGEEQAYISNGIPRLVYALALVCLPLRNGFQTLVYRRESHLTHTAGVADEADGKLPWLGRVAVACLRRNLLLVATLTLVLGPACAPVMLCSMFLACYLLRLVRLGVLNCEWAGLLWCNMSRQVFFYSGHSCSFSGLNFNSAYLGFDDFNYVRCGIMLATNTWAGNILAVSTLPLIAIACVAQCNPGRPELRHAYREKLARASMGFLLGVTTNASVAMAFAGVMRRHLMVWAIFAPKFMFEALGLLVTDALLLGFHPVNCAR